MDYLTNYNLEFNPKPPTKMHIDLNSCFATVEQQANHHLRGKPIAVAAYTTPNACILAPSIEAKKLGIKVGMRVREGKLLCQDLIVLEPDPPKYREVHKKLSTLLQTYTSDVFPKSIDEFVLDIEGAPSQSLGMHTIAKEIKHKIKSEIGDWLTVSIGIAPNRFLAKTASELNKPDGLDEINIHNHREIYRGLKLTDLCGIKTNNTARLNNHGIHTVTQFYEADIQKLRGAFHSIVGFYWFLRLKGWEIDDFIVGRHSFGNSYAIPTNLRTAEELSPILMKLVVKMARRMRRAGYCTSGIHVSLLFRSGNYWHQGRKLRESVYNSGDIYKEAYKVLRKNPYKEPVHTIAVSCYSLSKQENKQLSLFEDIAKKKSLTEATDKINDKWGEFVITPARMMGMNNTIIDRISFGGIKEIVMEN